MSAPAMPVPQPFPVPENFPVAWPAPEMAMKVWRQDRMHVPYPMTPMSEWFAHRFAKGFTSGFDTYQIPMKTEILRMNTYFFLGSNPVLPPEMMPEAEMKAAPLVQTAAVANGDRWKNEWLPELMAGWDEWGKDDLDALTDADLVAKARKGEEWFTRIWSIHFQVLLPLMGGASEFQDIYKLIFPDRPALAAYKLSQGFDNKSLEAGRELWLIARKAAENAELKRLIEATPADKLWAALESSADGQALRAEMTSYLSRYGRRSDNVQELATRSWTEDPSPALANLKMYVNDANDPREMMAKLAAEREAAVAEARAAIANAPAELKGGFEALLGVVQSFSHIQEDHNFWIDQRGVHEMRHLCLAIGRRLVSKGQLSAADDVLMLDMDEALAALADGSDQKAKVSERQAEMAYWSKIQPAPIIGMDYGPPPDNPMTRALFRFFGEPPSVAPTAKELHGAAGSPGKVTGIARVIMTIADGDRLGQDEILVTPTTAPPWTPLFATAGAVVTETGGVLSHCAIVSREYGIPAVVGAAGATSIIKDGDRIEVDGDAGLIRVLS